MRLMQDDVNTVNTQEENEKQDAHLKEQDDEFFGKLKPLKSAENEGGNLKSPLIPKKKRRSLGKQMTFEM